MDKGGKARIALLALLFFLSGAAGLVYEVAWSKRLELTFGSTTYSIGTILAAYMAGLGLGAWALSGLADRPGSPVKRYALLEAGIGVYGLVTPWVLDGIEAVYMGLGGFGGAFTKAVLGLIAILPATLLMGGTLPILARALVRSRGDAQRAVGLLYGINTLGAVAGSVLAGLVLTSWLGLDLTCRLTGVANLLLAGVALALGNRLAPDIPAEAAVSSDASTSPEPAAEAPPDSLEARALRLKLAIGATFAVGFVALSLEVAWTRALSLAFGSTGHGFTIVLAATLLGIGLGSLVAGAWSRFLPDDERAPLGPLALTLLLLGLACYGFQLGFASLPRLFFHLSQPRYLYYEGLLGAFFGISTLALLPATLAFGLAFPLAAQLGTQAAGQAGRAVGRLYLANTVGSILGSLLGAFVLLPALGELTAGGGFPAEVGRSGAGEVVRLGTLISAGGAAGLAFLSARYGLWQATQARAVGLLALAVAVAGFLQPVWDPGQLDLAPTRHRGTELPRQRGRYEQLLTRSGVVLRYAKEGLNAYVSVRTAGRTTVMMLGGKVDASTLGDMPTQILCGTVPFLARPQAERVLVVGAGSGVTARVASEFPSVKRLELVEIEEAMVEAARDYFGEVNHGVFARDNVQVVYDDARSFLLAAGPEQRYDVIVSVPTNPSIAGVANLFTLEHYQNARRHLSEDGVYLQWVQLYQSDDWQARAMLNTFAQAFPHLDVWWASPLDLLVLGSEQPLVYDREQVRQAVEANAGLMGDLRGRLLCHQPDELFSRYVTDRAGLLQLVGTGEVLHDRLPRLEGHAARTRYLATGPQALAAGLWQQRSARVRAEGPWPPLKEGQPPAQPDLRLAAGRFLATVYPAQTGDVLAGVPGPEAAALRARLTGSPLARQALLDQALVESPDHPYLLLEQAELYLSSGRRAEALPLLERLEAREDYRSARWYLVQARAIDPADPQSARIKAARAEAGLALVQPNVADMGLRNELLGELSLAAVAAPEARQILLGLYESRPFDEEAGMALAQAYRISGDPERCLYVLDLLEENNGMGWVLELQRLRLLALWEASRKADALLLLGDYLTWFPDEVNNPVMFPLIRAARDAT